MITEADKKAMNEYFELPFISIPHSGWPDNYGAFREQISIRRAVQMLIDNSDLVYYPGTPARIGKKVEPKGA